jgi:hypothetical protein
MEEDLKILKSGISQLSDSNFKSKFLGDQTKIENCSKFGTKRKLEITSTEPQNIERRIYH